MQFSHMEKIVLAVVLAYLALLFLLPDVHAMLYVKVKDAIGMEGYTDMSHKTRASIVKAASRAKPKNKTVSVIASPGLVLVTWDDERHTYVSRSFALDGPEIFSKIKKASKDWRGRKKFTVTFSRTA